MKQLSRHLEWLSLIEVSGPFLALSVLEQTFPQGLEAVETPLRQRLRAAYDEWRDAVDENDPLLPELHQEWIRLIVAELLEYDETILKSNDSLSAPFSYSPVECLGTFTPDHAVLGNDGTPRFFVSIQAPGTDLETVQRGDAWPVSLIERMTLLCREYGVRLGLVTNGEQWILINAPVGATSSHVSWYARLWFQEPVTLKAFVSLLGVRRSFGPADQTLEALLIQSLEHHEEITDTLGDQVRRAVEVLVQGLDKADEDRNRELLRDVSPAELYEAGLTVMMRLVFVLCAEERGLLLLGDQIYDQFYAISTLRGQLAEDAGHYGHEILDRRHDAWTRLLAVFRAIYSGIEYESLRMPALGGSLFDPNRFPFLEGRAKGTNWRESSAVPLPIDNRMVLMLLEALQVLEQKGGALLLSYKALDIEQIGHVYEGLLEYTVIRAPEITLGLIGSKKAKNPNLPLGELESARLDGLNTLVTLCVNATGRTEPAIANALQRPVDDVVFSRLLTVCGGDIDLAQRIRPFANLLRTDAWDQPIVYRPKAFMVTLGADRRETGTHYTPRSLTENIVETTLEPLVYQGPATGLPRRQWSLRSGTEILDLKVCDPTMGSGAFLVQACRWLAERLVEAWGKAEANGGYITIEGEVCSELGGADPMPSQLDERLLIARRLIAERCLYGVDINPLAVELAKLSIWLVTMAKGRPFGFLDHNLRSGDSLLGITTLDQLTKLSLSPSSQQQMRLFGQEIEKAVADAVEIRNQLRAIPIRDIRDVEYMARLDREAHNKLESTELVADAMIGEALRAGVNSGRLDTALNSLAILAGQIFEGDGAARRTVEDVVIEALRIDTLKGRQTRKPFHWPLEFPEVFVRGGFDAFVGNPPFMGGTLATEKMGEEYMSFLQRTNPPWHGKADYVIGFFKRVTRLLRLGGFFTLVSTASLLRGETLDSGLRDLMKNGWQIYAAISPYKWPGTANLEVVNVSLTQRWDGAYFIDGKEVEGITEELVEGIPDGRAPKELSTQHLDCALGIKLSPANREISYARYRKGLIEAPELAEFFVPTLGGDELYDLVDFDLAPRAIDPAKLQSFLAAGKKLSQRGGIEILSPKQYSHSAPAAGLMAKLSNSRFAFACGETSTALRFSRVPTSDCILKHKLIVFPANDWWVFAILQSEVHVQWAWRWGLRRESRIVYSPKRCALTFPLPSQISSQLTIGMASLSDIGRRFHEYRYQIMSARQEGLTRVYNRFHDPNDTSEDIAGLRSKQIEMDRLVVLTYGWKDLDLAHDFHETKQGIRFTISNTARVDLLQRLLDLNHERHSAESLSGNQKKGKAGSRRKAEKDAGSTPAMFADDSSNEG